MKKLGLFAIAGILSVSAGALWAVTSMDSANEASLDAENKEGRPVVASEVQASVPSTRRIFPGTVQAVSQVELGFSVPGKLLVFRVKEGMAFSEGDVLASLDSRDYEYALNIAQANYAEAHSAFARKQTLFKEGVISDSDFELAKARLDMAKGELDSRNKALEDTVLKAPFDGVVSQTYVENFEHVGAAQPVLSFQDVSVVEVKIDVPEDIIALKEGPFLDDLKVRFKADRLGRWFDQCHISEYKTQADPLTGTYEVVIQLDMPKDFVVLPGMTASVEADIPNPISLNEAGQDSEAHLTRVPVEAIVRNAAGDDYVWVVRDEEAGTIERILVKTARITEAYVEIYSSILPGERVITSAVDQMRDDIQVRLIKSAEGGLSL